MCINPALMNDRRQLRARASMIAEASAAQTTQIGHAHPQSRMPPGAFTGQLSTLEACDEWMDLAIEHGSDSELEAAIGRCATLLDLLQHGAPNRFKEPDEQFRERVLNDYEGLTIPEIIRREHGTTYAKYLRDLRIADGRDGRLGHKL